MKKSLHPAAIAAIVGLLAVALGFLFAKFGSVDAKDAPIADTMKIEVSHNKVNSLTGEPLLPDQLEAQRRQNEMVQKMQGTAQDPRQSGTVPNFQPNAH